MEDRLIDQIELARQKLGRILGDPSQGPAARLAASKELDRLVVRGQKELSDSQKDTGG